MSGPRRRVERVLDQVIFAVNWISSALNSDDNDIEAQIDDASGHDNAGSAPAEVWTIAGVQSRPKDGSESDGYAKALRVQLGDAQLIIGTHDPRHVESCEPGELVLHALGDDGSRRAKIVIKPDGKIDVSGTEVIIGNPDGTLEKIALGDALESHSSSIQTWLDAHTHACPNNGSGNVLTSGPTLSATGAPPDPSPSPPTLKSSKHSVET